MKKIMINDLELIENFHLLNDKKVVLYGAGKIGQSIYLKLKSIGKTVSFFCDGNPEKWGHCPRCTDDESNDDIKIISPDQLKRLDQSEKVVIIITVQNTQSIKQIAQLLEQVKIKTKNIYTSYGFELFYARNMSKFNITKDYEDLLRKFYRMRNQSRVLQNRAHRIGGFINDYFENFMNEMDNTDIIIYQPGKVGSITIKSSLDKMGIKSFHTHRIATILEVDGLEDIFAEVIKNRKIKIITLVREPLIRMLSLFFQGLSVWNLERIQSENSFLELCERWMIKDHTDIVMGKQFEWFDIELKAVFGVDVYAYPFDKERGYGIIQQGNIEVLVMKMEKMNGLEKVIGEFVGAPDFKLTNANESSSKPYNYLYQNIMDVIKIPQAAADRYYQNNLRMDHFYSQEEKNQFLDYWKKYIV
ncbi:MAG: putative capsular polysaccharide synthesis family protein [Lachnospiraceae bacterium]|nr:putative capsular polysaccharide synthesis family protein [Lachnospiraceae bacterium]